MREYKFRGKRIDNGEWVYGNLIYDNIADKYWIDLSINESEKIEGGLHIYAVEVDPETVGQYTGLRDKNRKEIYDGDILKYAGGGIYTVVFNEMMIMCPHDNIKMPSPGYYGILVRDKTKELCPLGVTQRLAKVIGNIYDNLEGTK